MAHHQGGWLWVKEVTLAPEEAAQLPPPRAVFIPLKAPVPSVVSTAVYRKGEKNTALANLLGMCREV